MKKLVKAHGGNVTGDLRFSISWNADLENNNDMDAHAIMPAGGPHICYYNKVDAGSRGCLDVDIRSPGAKEAVENITWPDRRNMPDGNYKLFVDTFSNRGGRGPLRAEVEFDGVTHTFEYPGTTSYDTRIPIATVTLDKGTFSIKPGPYATGAGASGKHITWGVTENSFTRVLSVIPSPGHWEGETGHGLRHIMFVLDECSNPEQPNAFFNEFLKPELTPHRKVLEALGRSLKVEPAEEQLSGVGFVATRPVDMVVRAHGATVRTLRVTQ